MFRLFLLICLLYFPAQAAKISYPKIQNLQGSVWQIKELVQVENKQAIKEAKPQAVKKTTTLKDQALLQVEKNSEISFQLNDHSRLQIFADSEVEFPSIHWKDGVINEIRLRKGKIRYTCEKNCDLKIATAISETVFPVGEFLLTYDPNIPEIELLVLSGEAIFRGLENEITSTLREGEKARFTGIHSQDGTIAYDILLKGRKLAQGNLSEKEKMNVADFAALKKSFEDKIKIKKAVSDKEKAFAKKVAGEICKKPSAKLDQCAWICEKNPKSSKDCSYDRGAQCIRMRCNANGEWADQTILPLKDAKCSASIFVSNCDY